LFTKLKNGGSSPDLVGARYFPLALLRRAGVWCSLLRFGRKGTEIKLPAYGGSGKISTLPLFFLSYAGAALLRIAPKALLLVYGGITTFLEKKHIMK